MEEKCGGERRRLKNYIYKKKNLWERVLSRPIFGAAVFHSGSELYHRWQRRNACIMVVNASIAKKMAGFSRASTLTARRKVGVRIQPAY